MARDARTGWWHDAVVYEIYPRSFADSDGDGVGDLAGIVSRLDYVAGLGVDAVWLTPFQQSPQADHGYDVSDYCDVDPLFGDLDGFDALLAAAHARRLRVIVDLVPNHCSRQHTAFLAAVAAGPGSAERASFHFAPGRGPGGGDPPNNWPSVFGGPAWTRVTEPDGSPGEWYLHLYAPEQPDWNWRDRRTGDFFEGVIRFWLDRGVDGLRIDVAHGLFKAAGLPDLEHPDEVEPGRLRGNPLACDQPEVHDVYRRWRVIADSYDPPRALIGEVNLSPVRAALYTRPDELHQAFAFGFLVAPWDATVWRDTAAELLNRAALSGTSVTWVVENHDVVRAATRYASGDRARAALLAILGLPGAAYIYQGQELGLPEVDVPPERRQDPAWLRSGMTRDGCRVPLPWTRNLNGAYGFSDAPDVEPWLPVPPGWGDLSFEAQDADVTSTLRLCREALTIRAELHARGVLRWDDRMTWTLDRGALIASRGDHFALVVTMGHAAILLPAGRLLLSTRALTTAGMLPVDAAAWLHR